MSDEGKDLIKRLLTLDPKKRISSTEALEHAWMQDEEVVGKARKIMEAAARNVAMPPPPQIPVRLTIDHIDSLLDTISDFNKIARFGH